MVYGRNSLNLAIQRCYVSATGVTKRNYLTAGTNKEQLESALRKKFPELEAV